MEEVYKLDEKWDYDNDFISNKIGGTWNVFGEKLKGELTYSKSNGNITLELYKTINSQEEYFKFINNDERIDYIKGITNNNKDCILNHLCLLKYLMNLVLRLIYNSRKPFLQFHKSCLLLQFLQFYLICRLFQCLCN